MLQAYRLTAHFPPKDGSTYKYDHQASLVVPGTSIQDALGRFTKVHPNAKVQNIQHIGAMFEEAA